MSKLKKNPRHSLFQVLQSLTGLSTLIAGPLPQILPSRRVHVWRTFLRCFEKPIWKGWWRNPPPKKVALCFWGYDKPITNGSWVIYITRWLIRWSLPALHGSNSPGGDGLKHAMNQSHRLETVSQNKTLSINRTLSNFVQIIHDRELQALIFRKTRKKKKTLDSGKMLVGTFPAGYCFYCFNDFCGFFAFLCFFLIVLSFFLFV